MMTYADFPIRGLHEQICGEQFGLATGTASLRSDNTLSRLGVTSRSLRLFHSER